LCDRTSIDEWQALGRPDLYSIAREQVRQILAVPVQNPLPAKVSAAFEDILKRASAELTGFKARL
jgi:trimethylamine:corrinoid methyltransferase-like protein